MSNVLHCFDGAIPKVSSIAGGAVAVAAHPGAAELHAADGQIIAIWGRPRIERKTLGDESTTSYIVRALSQTRGHIEMGFLDKLAGTFAIAVIDSKSCEAMLVTDHLGSQPVCYATIDGALVFASTLDALKVYSDTSPTVDSQAIFDYVYFHMVPGPQTIYKDWKRLPAGHYLRWRNGQADVKAYWQMRYVEDLRRPFPELKDEFRDCLRTSIQEAAADGRVGTFLSGGTDSSTVAGILTEVMGQPARTYSIGFEAQGYDEMEFARIAARHFGTHHHEYYVTPADVVSAIPKIASIHDQPFGNASAVPTFFCARLAREDGITALLGGDGGDELFGGNERYAKQHLYSLYSDLPKGLRKGLIEPVAFLLPELGIVGKAQRYMRNASVAMPARYDNYNLLQRLGAANVFTAEFLQSVSQELPAARIAESYALAHAESLINRMLALDLKYTLTDNDLPKVVRSCELASVEVRFPLLDDRVLNFSAKLAPRMKLKGTKLRYFFKEALRDFLPPEIITKSKHGFGLPFGPWMKTHEPLRQIALDSLSRLKQRHIIRPQLIDELTSVHVHTHADYFGTMVWILMMLEQWLAQRRVTI